MQVSAEFAAVIATLAALAVGFVVWRRNAGRSPAARARRPHGAGWRVTSGSTNDTLLDGGIHRMS